MAFEKGNNLGSGRPKGASNKETKAIREMIIEALDQLGGVDYLVQQAKDNPNAFIGLIAKVMPTQISGNLGITVSGVTVGYEPPNNSTN